LGAATDDTKADAPASSVAPLTVPHPGESAGLTAAPRGRHAPVFGLGHCPRFTGSIDSLSTTRLNALCASVSLGGTNPSLWMMLSGRDAPSDEDCPTKNPRDGGDLPRQR
jgi:hypothetical protein